MTRQKIRASQVSAFITKFLKKNKLINGKTVEITMTKNELIIRLLESKSRQKKKTKVASGWNLIPLDRKMARFIAEDASLEYEH
jgi:hypothetical protein